MVESGMQPQAFEPLDLKIYITQNVVFYRRQKGTFSVRREWPGSISILAYLLSTFTAV